MPATLTSRASRAVLGAVLAILVSGAALPLQASGTPPRLHPPSGGSGDSGGVPQTLITYGPAFKTRERTVVFRFTDTTEQPGASFLCKLDGRGWDACRSPLKLEHLTPGRHLLRVRAVSGAGVRDPRPARHEFEVLR